MSGVDLSTLPLDRRVRVEIVALLSAAAGRAGPAAATMFDRLPAPLRDGLARLGAPMRLSRRPEATVPFDARFPEPADEPCTRSPRATIVVVCHGGREHVRLCLSSIRAFTDPASYELIVVDNRSTDGTGALLEDLAGGWPHLTVVSPERNLGFPAGVNAGARRARGEVVVICNHDIVVTPGWLDVLLGHLDAEGVGVVGPVTNDSGDLASRRAQYGDLDEMLRFAAHRADAHRAQSEPVDKLSLFCTALRRDLFEDLGGLDEGYGLGMFEDDDLCAAVVERGLSARLAEDVWVHHAAGVAFRSLSAREYVARFEVNKLRFERKWGRRWRVPR